MKIGAMELIVILIVALIVIGPDKLPYYTKKLGVALREFRKVSDDMTKDVRESVIEPLQEAQKPLRDAMKPLDDLNKEIKGNFTSVEKDLKNIGKAPAKDASKSEKKAEEEPAPAEEKAEEAQPEEAVPVDVPETEAVPEAAEAAPTAEDKPDDTNTES